MPIQTPKDILRLNESLRRDLGTNPRYAWRWSEDLLHVMNLTGDDGHPVKKVRKLFPQLVDQWVICALIELNEEDGAILGTGRYTWMPVTSRRSHAVALLPGERPDAAATESFVQQMRAYRERKLADEEADYARKHIDPVPLDEDYPEMGVGSRSDKKKYEHNLIVLDDAAAAFKGIPGKKGHVSFPPPQSQIEDIQ